MLDSTLTLPNGVVLPNRLAKASMSEALADRTGAPTPGLTRLYARWARGGVGLMLTGNVMVDRRFLERPSNVILTDDSSHDELVAWARAAKSHGAKVIMQISHPGRQTQRMVAKEPVAPSAVAAVNMLKSFGKPRALAHDEILDIIAAFARAAAYAEAAGFDGVQIHAAHGYLISQFLSPLTNVRDDRWGGSLDNRASFLLETVRAVRARVSAGFVIAVKLNSADFQRGGFGEDDALAVVRMLDEEKIDLLEISGGNYESPALFGIASAQSSTARREAYFLDFARKVRAISKVPLMVTGGFRSRAAMVQALDEGALDIVGLARPLAVFPDLPSELLRGGDSPGGVDAPRVRSRTFGPVAEGAWYGHQLVRMALGKEPAPRLSVWRALISYLVGDAVASFRRSRPRPSLPAAGARLLGDGSPT